MDARSGSSSSSIHWINNEVLGDRAQFQLPSQYSSLDSNSFSKYSASYDAKHPFLPINTISKPSKVYSHQYQDENKIYSFNTVMSVDNKLDKSKEHFYNNHQQQTIKKTPHKVLRYVRDNRQRYDNGYTIQDVYRNSSQLALKKEKAAALYSSSSTNNHKQNLRSYNKSKGIGFITETSKPRSAESSKVTNTHRNIKHNLTY